MKTVTKSYFHLTWYNYSASTENAQILYTEELYKKGLNYLDNDDDDVTHLEPDVLYCEVKWALGSITIGKDSGGDGIPAELFQILKDNAIKMLQTCQQILKTQPWPQEWKRLVFILLPKKGNAKECSSSVQFSHSVVSDPMNRSMPGLPVHHQLLEFTQTHVHRVSEIQGWSLVLMKEHKSSYCPNW